MGQKIPKVSVTIIFLNPSAAYLAEAVASVRAQTLEDWELILVDDGSTDDASAFARSAAAAEPERIRYLEHPGHANLGMSASRNLGISAARGRYLALLDADDTYLPGRLAHQVAILDAEPDVAMVYGPYLYWYSWQADATDADRVSPLGLATETTHPPPTVLEAFITSGGHILPGICSLTVRSEAVAAVGGFEPEFRGCYEDQIFLAKICGRFPVHITSRCLDRYRQHDASCTAEAARTGEYLPELPHPARERFLRWLQAYLEREGPNTPAIRRALKRELWPYDHPGIFKLVGLPILEAKFALKRLKRGVIRRRSRARQSSRVARAG
jgi:hypothetical protein